MGSSPVCNVIYGGDVITMTYTTKLRPSGGEVINMTWCQVFITNGINMGGCLVVSDIIRTFVLSVVKFETGR
jgi:hypothetical protein